MNAQKTIQDIDETLKEIQTMVRKKSIEQNQKSFSEIATKRLPIEQKSDGLKGLKHFIANGLSEKNLTSSQQSGGFSIPSYLSVEHLMKGRNLQYSLRPFASVTEITSDKLELLKEKGNTFSGWVQEEDARDQTEVSEFDKQFIFTHEIYAKPKISQKLLDDSSIDLGEWIENKIFDTMAVQENLAFIKGNGEGKPKGILAYLDDGLTTFKTGVKGQIKNADILLDALNSLPSQMLSDAVWMMSRSALGAIRSLKDNATGRYLLQPSLDSSFGSSIFGFPVVINDALDVAQSGVNSTPILFGNFKRGYQIVDRKDVNLLRDPFSSKPFVEFYATKRVGGDVINKNAITVVQFSD